MEQRKGKKREETEKLMQVRAKILRKAKRRKREVEILIEIEKKEGGEERESAG